MKSQLNFEIKDEWEIAKDFYINENTDCLLFGALYLQNFGSSKNKARDTLET